MAAAVAATVPETAGQIRRREIRGGRIDFSRYEYYNEADVAGRGLMPVLNLTDTERLGNYGPEQSDTSIKIYGGKGCTADDHLRSGRDLLSDRKMDSSR